MVELFFVGKFFFFVYGYLIGFDFDGLVEVVVELIVLLVLVWGFEECFFVLCFFFDGFGFLGFVVVEEFLFLFFFIFGLGLFDGIGLE